MLCTYVTIFFLNQKTAYGVLISDWSSDVCSSDLGTHGPHAIAGQVPQPVLDPRVWLGTMVAVVVGDQRTPHPQIGFRPVLGYVEVVQRLVHRLQRAERPLDLALGAGRGVPYVGLRRPMGETAEGRTRGQECGSQCR